MGGFVDYRCFVCGYQQDSIAVGHGKNAMPYLTFTSCATCKTVGSTWIEEGSVPRCGVCYEKNPQLLANDTRLLPCPKCGQTGAFTPRSEIWE